MVGIRAKRAKDEDIAKKCTQKVPEIQRFRTGQGLSEGACGLSGGIIQYYPV